MLVLIILSGLLISYITAPAIATTSAPLDTISTWEIVFNSNSELDPYPISVDILGNVKGDGMLCVDAPVADWATVTITPKNLEVNGSVIITKCDASQGMSTVAGNEIVCS